MKLENNTPFPAVAWENVDAKKTWHITTLIRVKYILCANSRSNRWDLRLTPDQGDLFFEDIYHHDDPNMPVRYESDFATYKPNADVILNANTYSPDGTFRTRWSCGVKITDMQGTPLLYSALKVMGEARWELHPPLGWIREDVRAIDRLPVRYDKAYGGTLLNHTDSADDQPAFLSQDESNPVGTGIRHRRMSETTYLEHQLEWESDSGKKMYPAGFGAIARSWKTRLVHAGTYDQEWIDEQHPYPPFDFDYKHNQAANPDLVLRGYVQPGTVFSLYNLFPGGGMRQFVIPELYCFSDLFMKNGKKKRMLLNIDTVLIDIDHAQPDKWCVYLSYRGFHKKTPLLDGIVFSYLPKELLEQRHG